MRILHISDTHGCHHRLRDWPEADVLVHSGDFCMVGSQQEALDFLNWFCDLPYRHKVFICGNHDDCLYQANIGGLDKNVHYLCNSGVELEGIKFYGVPMFMNDCSSGKQRRFYASIPDDIDVLITHAAAYGIFDYDNQIHYGSEGLLDALTRISPRCHLFGHTHMQHGMATIGHTQFSNGAILKEGFEELFAPNLLYIDSFGG